ncbi:MAG: reverse transcriptase/maturase family protein [Patescibacteria group bacterium]
MAKIHAIIYIPGSNIVQLANCDPSGGGYTPIKSFMKKFTHTFEDIISIENLLEAWREFVCGKRNRCDVQEFHFNLMDNIFSLHSDLANHTYKHGPYQGFSIWDPKPRSIHKASIRDRLVHHAVYRVLYPFFDKIFISDSFSCRFKKGTHKSLNRFRLFSYTVSKNNTQTCWILKCDLKKFFATIDQTILINILEKCITDKSIIWLLKEIISSFSSMRTGVGLPLGNLTSQLLVNIYMNEFDQFIKHGLGVKYYIRYADDFVILLNNKNSLQQQIGPIKEFIEQKLKLTIHPDKIFIKTLASGLDFLGWIHFSDHRILRTSTKRRMFKKLKENYKSGAIESYKGLLKHGNTHNIFLYQPFIDYKFKAGYHLSSL